MSIRLEELEREDFPRIRGWIDPGIFRIFTSPVDDPQLEQLLSKSENGEATEIGMRAVDSVINELVGLIHAVINRQNDCAHIQQLVVAPALRDRGYGAAILIAFLDILFASQGLHRAQLFVDEDNRQAVACYEKVGFRLDGLMRDNIKTERGYVSMCVYSLLCDEWLGQKRG